MSLPKLQHPTFDVKIPSNKEVFSFRPYTVREQKVLLMLKESIDAEELTKNIKSLIESCCTSGSINVDKLTYFDIEYIFLQIRIHSVGETSNLKYKCNNIVEESRCNEINEIVVDLTTIEPDFSTSPKNDIDLPNGIKLNLSFPGLKSTKNLEEYNQSRNIDTLMKVIYSDSNYIADSTQIWEDYTESEFIDFLNNLDVESFERIIEFYLNIPKLKKNVEYVCEKCGYKETIVLEGISDFFE